MTEPGHYSGVNVGSELTEEERAFGRAVDDFKRDAGRPFPTWSEVLEVVRAMGYRKVSAPDKDFRGRCRERRLNRRGKKKGVS